MSTDSLPETSGCVRHGRTDCDDCFMEATLSPEGYVGMIEGERDRARQEAAEYRHIGDLMQSEASRLAEWAEKAWKGSNGVEMPYEVRMAILGLTDAIESWTQTRIGYATSKAV